MTDGNLYDTLRGINRGQFKHRNELLRLLVVALTNKTKRTEYKAIVAKAGKDGVSEWAREVMLSTLNQAPR